MHERGLGGLPTRSCELVSPLTATREARTVSPAGRIAECANAHSAGGRYTASFVAFTGRALTIFRAGLALNIVGSLVKGLIPWRALVAGFLMTMNFARPGTRKTPFFLSSLWPTLASASITPLTSFFASSFSVAIFSISCDLVIWVAILASSPVIRDEHSSGKYSPAPRRTRSLHSFCAIRAGFFAIRGAPRPGFPHGFA